MSPALAPVLVTPPAAVPVSLAEAKAHLRVEHGEDDGLIEAMIGAAVGRLDGWGGILGRCLVTQDWRRDFCGFPCGYRLRLPFPDVSAVTIVYSDAADAEQTLSAADYGLFQDVGGSVAILKATAAWPATYDRPDAVRVTFTAGYGAAAAVPAAIRHAILLMVGDLYRFRESVGAAAMAAVPMSTTVDALIAPYRQVSF